ncbi:two-component regulator propeller domain-containing protein [Arcticibacter sp.]|uniref:hybrid sensor histidine kinase/response regulator transcription factor n=1 Tax=Arcticibacter sp. TaxID=1872630 RepID=UPI00388F5914
MKKLYWKRSKCFYLAVGLLVFMTRSSLQLTAQVNSRIEHYSTENGLSHDAVTDIMKDREGFMWFGTWNGLNRFDGHEFVSYAPVPGDKSSLKTPRIYRIFEDLSNHLWLTGYDEQIYRFDKGTHHFLNFSDIVNKRVRREILFSGVYVTRQGSVWVLTKRDGLFHIPDPKEPEHFRWYRKGASSEWNLLSDHIAFFHEDTGGRIWVGTDAGLICLEKRNGTYRRASSPSDTLDSFRFTVFHESKEFMVFGTSDGTVVIYDKRSAKLHTRKLTSGSIDGLVMGRRTGKIHASTSKGELFSFDVAKGQAAKMDLGERLFSIYEDRSGVLWIEPEFPGVIRFDPVRKTVRRFSQTIDTNMQGKNYYQVFEDINGIVWVNMKGGGFGYYNHTEGEIQYFHNEPGSGDRMFSNVVYDLFYDKAGVLWLNTDDRGVHKVVFQASQFARKLLVAPARFNSDNDVRAVFSDRKNRMWFGVKSSKLYVLQDGRKLKNVFVNEPEGGLGDVYTIMGDRQGNIWLGTKGKGLYKAAPINADESQYKLTSYQPDKTGKSSMSGKEIYSVFEDRRGRIWVGTFDKGLHLLVQKNHSAEFVCLEKLLKVVYPRKSFRRVRYVTEDSMGNIWVGTAAGLIVFNIEHPGRIKMYSKISGDLASLGANDIQYILRDSKDRMWICSSGGGLSLAVGKQPVETLKFKNYTTKQGLASNFLLSCVEDDGGDLWLSTQSGLSKLDTKKGIVRNFDSQDGLPKSIFSESSCAKQKNGNLVFGTTKGYIVFNPQRLHFNKDTSNVVFTRLQVNSQEVLPEVEGSIIRADINSLPEVVLNHDQNIFSIDYATLDYRSNNKQVYRYRLQEFDKIWRTNGSDQRRITYTNLAPGNYKLELELLNPELYSNNLAKSLHITILPPPWRTWWAYSLYALLFVVGAGLVRRVALTMIRLQNKVTVEKKLAELKVNFFTNISHELRTPLTLILNPIEEVFRDETLSPVNRRYVEIARRNAARMARVINQLLDLRKVQSGKAVLRVARVEVISFVKKIGKYFDEECRQKQISLSVKSNCSELFCLLDAEKLDTVLYNLLANALKFTPAGKSIEISICSDGREKLIIEVKDEGPGVQEEKLKDIFELYYEAHLPEGRAVKGTGIGLALCKDLVEVQGGKISAFNNPVAGLTVSVELKVSESGLGEKRVEYLNQPYSPSGESEAAPGWLGKIGQKGLEKPADDYPMLLVVEDNADLRAFLVNELRDCYRIEEAIDGEEGLKKAQELLPDLIISDVMMPKVDGIQMLGQLKQDINTSHIPVIMLSAKASIESQIEGLRYGADCYIPKPFHKDFLMASIANLLTQRKVLFERLIQQRAVLQLSPGEIIITSSDEAFLKKVISIVEEHMADADFNIDTVAESIGMGRTSFYRKFKSLTDLAPVEFVRNMRLQRGKQMMDAGESNVSTVAYTVGFSNPKYFTKCFREKYQVTPTAYLKSLIAN